MNEQAHNPEQFDSLEVRLARTLRRMEPTNERIHRVRNRLRFPGPRTLARRLSDWEYLLIVVGGVASLTVFLITFIRFLVGVLTRRSG